MLRYRKIIGIILVIAIFYFIGNMVAEKWVQISEHDWSPNVLWLLISILILFSLHLMSALGWTLLLKMIGVKIEWFRGITIFLLSMFARYIPGGVWSAMGRLYLCRLEGIPDSRSSMSILLEQAYPVVSAGLVFVMSLLFWNNTDFLARVLPAVFLLPIFFVFLHPKPFLKIMNPVLSWIGRGPIHIVLSFKNMLILAVSYSFYWLMAGIAFYCFFRGFFPLGLYYIPILSGIYAISFTVGYLAFFTPAGLGIREASLVMLLSLFIPTPIALGGAVLSRLWLLGVELIILVVFIINTETRKMAKTALGW